MSIRSTLQVIRSKSPDGLVELPYHKRIYDRKTGQFAGWLKSSDIVSYNISVSGGGHHVNAKTSHGDVYRLTDRKQPNREVALAVANRLARDYEERRRRCWRVWLSVGALGLIILLVSWGLL